MTQGVARAPFAHEALVYRGIDDLVARTAPVIREAVAREEPVLVALTVEKLAALRSALGEDAETVHFADITRVGRNPAWMLPALQRFVDEQGSAGVPVRGIGEPMGHPRSPDEIAECQLHEELVNVAFAGRAGIRLTCPYDAGALEPGLVHAARCSHPVVVEDGVAVPSGELRRFDPSSDARPPLRPPPGAFDALGIERRTLRDVRALVARRAAEADLPGWRVQNAVTAVHELAANSVRHGGGTGVLRLWTTDTALVCEVRDRGHIADPLAGRRRPAHRAEAGRGLWIATQAADLLQIRSEPGGTTVRLEMRRA